MVETLNLTSTTIKIGRKCASIAKMKYKFTKLWVYLAVLKIEFFIQH